MTNPPTQVAEKPQHLYKYCTAGRAAQILRDQYVYLAPIGRLNDLFEFAFLALLSENDDTPRDYYTKILMANGLQPESARDMARSTDDADVRSSYEEWKRDRLAPVLANIRHHSGVACFSAESDNQRMWASYGHDHRGACLEFALGRQPCPFEGRLLPIIYSTRKTGFTFADLINDDASLNQDVLIFLSTIKHAHWRDEKEWRVLFLDKEEKGGDSRQLALSRNTISRVFLGPRISDSDEAKINAIVHEQALGVSVIRRTVQGLFGTTAYEGFEVSSSAQDVFYWLKKLKPGLRSQKDEC